MVIVEIQAEAGITKLFAQGGGVHVLAAVKRPITMPGFNKLVHAHVVFFGEAIAGEGHLAVVLIEALGVADPVGLAHQGTVAGRYSGTGLGDIHRQRAKSQQVTAGTHRQRTVILGAECAAIQRPAITYTPGKLASGEDRAVHLMLPVGRLTACQLVAHRPRTRQIRNAGGVHCEILNTAVLFFDAHIQLTTDRIVKVLDTKGARRHLSVVKHPALLADHHASVGAGHARDLGGIASKIGRQHIVVTAQVGACVAEAAEQVGVQVAFADNQART